jgi:putative nucleotidyltransferase with HDIG domain
MNMELRKALYNISALADLGAEITSEKNFHEKLGSLLHVALGTFLAGKGAIAYREKPECEIAFVARKGFGDLSVADIDLGPVLAAGRNRPYRPEGSEALLAAGVEIITPLWDRNDFIGFVLLGRKFTKEPYTEDDIEMLGVIAHQIAIMLKNHALFHHITEQLEENRKLYEEMRRIYHDTLQAFAAAIDAKDVYTRHHSQRVAKYSVAIARELGWSEHDIEGIYVAGFLHDVGKLVISNEILNKKTPFTPDEMKEVRRHSLLSYKIISQIRFPWKDVEKIVKHHHERLDGTGYPDALSKENLSEGAKILTLADSFDAMTSERAYRQKMDVRKALAELKNCLHRQFDDKILLAFCKVLDKEIRGELPEPDILPHLDRGSDLSVISALLGGIIEELSGDGPEA